MNNNPITNSTSFPFSWLEEKEEQSTISQSSNSMEQQKENSSQDVEQLNMRIK